MEYIRKYSSEIIKGALKEGISGLYNQTNSNISETFDNFKDELKKEIIQYEMEKFISTINQEKLEYYMDKYKKQIKDRLNRGFNQLIIKFNNISQVEELEYIEYALILLGFEFKKESVSGYDESRLFERNYSFTTYYIDLNIFNY